MTAHPTSTFRAKVIDLPQPCETELADAWFVHALTTARMDAATRRAQFGVGSANAPEQRSAFAQQFAPRVRPGVELNESRVDIDHAAVELEQGRFALSPQFQR